jgi:Putative zinc-finger
MQDAWMNRLSEYLDEELDPEEYRALEEHLGVCPECASTLAELRQVRARARDLEDAPPPASLWTRIEAGILARRTISFPEGAIAPERSVESGRGRDRRLSFSVPQLIAACLAVALVSGGAVFMLVRAPKSPVGSLARAPVSGAPRTAPVWEREATPLVASEPTSSASPAATTLPESPHEEAIAELRKALARERERLDPATIRTLESNLAIIDLAIDQAKRALAADPANTYVKEHLADTMRRKVELLQRATMLASASNTEGSR